jgi:hypothetical protein
MSESESEILVREYARERRRSEALARRVRILALVLATVTGALAGVVGAVAAESQRRHDAGATATAPPRAR